MEINYNLREMKIDIDQVLYYDRYEIKDKSEEDLRVCLRSYLKNLLNCKISVPAVTKTGTLFFRSLVRDDYKVLFHDIAETLQNNDIVFVEDYLSFSQGFNIEASEVLIKLHPMYYAFSASSPLERSCLYVRLCYYFLVLKSIARIDFKNLVLFSDMQPVEDFISQYVQKYDKRTISLQHGLYVDYGNYDTINKINYLHQPSRYFLAWGENTASLISRHHPSTQVTLCGKPRISAMSEVDASSVADHGQSYFTVVLDQSIFDEYNFKLLRIMSSFSAKNGMVMNVKFHPYNKKIKYNHLKIQYVEGLPLRNSQFVVGHTSSLIYEVMCYGVPVYKFRSDIPCLATPEEISFDSLVELENSLAVDHDFLEISRQYISHFGPQSLERYREFFKSIS